MIELLQNKNSGYIVLVNSGNFYIARGQDAVLLNKILGLKVNCLECEVCKVGFPLNSIEKYTKQIEEKNYSYIVYKYDSKNSKLTKIKEYSGEFTNKETEKRLNCYICKNTVKIYKKEDKLLLIPKIEIYIEYMLQIYFKLPRTEKFSIGNEYKTSMYEMLKDVMFLTKADKKYGIYILNRIDANLNAQRIYLRIMKKEKWIDEKKFKIAMEKIYEIGKIIGGLFKYYAKNDKK